MKVKKAELNKLISEIVQEQLGPTPSPLAPKVGDKLVHRSSGAEMLIKRVAGDNLTLQITKLGTLKGPKVGDFHSTSSQLIGKTYEHLVNQNGRYTYASDLNPVPTSKRDLEDFLGSPLRPSGKTKVETITEPPNTMLADMLDLLVRVGDYMEDKADVVDGDYGAPHPNIEMSFSEDIQSTIEKLEQYLR